MSRGLVTALVIGALVVGMGIGAVGTLGASFALRGLGRASFARAEMMRGWDGSRYGARSAEGYGGRGSMMRGGPGAGVRGLGGDPQSCPGRTPNRGQLFAPVPPGGQQ